MKRFLDQLTPRTVIILMLCVGVIQVAAYYLAGMTVRSDGGMAIAQPDTLLYCQAARRIVEGAAFSFSAGTDPSTGTTSVLYPFVLAVPYWLGCRGDSLLLAGFVLNAAFYLTFLVGWGLVILQWFGDRPFPRAVAAGLLVCFGPCAYCALAQSDIGCWMGMSAFLVWGLLTNRRLVWIPLLVLAPWLRPEGMMLAAALGVVLAGKSLLKRGQTLSWKDWAGCILAILSLSGVFLLNWSLTGEAQFASVANKGYLTRYPFAQAIAAAAADGLELLKAYWLGLPASMPRNLMFLPLLGALTLWVGILGRDWRRTFTWRQGVLFLAVAGTFGTVATSGWQDKNLDRYLAWVWPLLLLFMAEGMYILLKKFHQFKIIEVFAVSQCAFMAVMSIVFVCLFHTSCDRADRCRAFAEQCEETMTQRSAIGLWSNPGVAYEFSSRRVAHLGGVYSPEFRSKAQVSKLETLKRDPSTRFWYYFYDGSDDPFVWGGAEKVLLPEQILVGPDGFELRQAKWTALDAAESFAVPPKEGLSLCDRVDVGYEIEEKSHDYEILTNYHMPLFEPFTQVGDLRGQTIVDGGRLVFGGDEMTVKAEPGKDLYVVMRTCPARTVSYARNLDRGQFVFSFENPMELHLEVDEEEIGHATFSMATNGFSDAFFVIPGKHVKTANPRVGFHGDHISCGYWFYQ